MSQNITLNIFKHKWTKEEKEARRLKKEAFWMKWWDVRKEQSIDIIIQFPFLLLQLVILTIYVIKVYR